VYIDGVPAAGRAAARLAAIAADEGLRTLGPMDAGHVELLRVERGGPTVARARAGLVPPADAKLAARARTVTEAMPAAVASVATPATVAQLAAVATVASSIATRSAAPPKTEAKATAAATVPPEMPASETPHDAAPLAAPLVSMARPDAGEADRRSMRGDARERRADARPVATTPTATDWTSMLAPASSRGSIAPDLASVAPIAGATMEARIDAIDALQNGAQSDALASIVLKLDTPEGTVDRVRIDLRGTTVGATVDVADGARALDLASRTQELTNALAARGLETEAVRVRATGAGDGLHGVWSESAPTAARGLASPSSSGASQDRGRESGNGGGRTAHDDERPRSRRQPGGNPK
jgi:hypothetical protein